MHKRRLWNSLIKNNQTSKQRIPWHVLSICRVCVRVHVHTEVWGLCELSLPPETQNDLLHSRGLKTSAEQVSEWPGQWGNSTTGYLKTLEFLLASTVHLKTVYILGSRFNGRYKTEKMIVLKADLGEGTRVCNL